MDYQCPHCYAHCDIDERHFKSKPLELDFGNTPTPVQAITVFIECTNPSCRKYMLSVELKEKYYEELENGRRRAQYKQLKVWRLVPESMAKVFPDYIPEPIRNDYQEACLILSKSPKASATLSRRCLQGMIRDYHGISDRTLYREIDAIREKVEPLVWEAINAIREIGNIGAHMEEDINHIVDVDDNEAALLIQLIEQLMTEWYINHHERQQRLAKLVEANQKKQEQRKQISTSAEEESKKS